MSDLSQHPLAQPVEPLPKKSATPNGQEKSGKKDSSKATTSDAPPLVAATGPDPTQPIDLKMVRTADLTLDHQNGAKALVVGNYTANNGGIDGTVHRIVRYPNGAIVATVRKRKRIGEEVKQSDAYLIVQGTLECEVMSEAERKERFE